MIPATYLPVFPAGQPPKENGSRSDEPGKGFGALVHGPAKNAAREAAPKATPAQGADPRARQDRAAERESAAEPLVETGTSVDDPDTVRAGGAVADGDSEDASKEDAAQPNSLAFPQALMMQRRLPGGFGRSGNGGDQPSDDKGGEAAALASGEAGALPAAEQGEVAMAANRRGASLRGGDGFAIPAGAIAVAAPQGAAPETPKQKSPAASSASEAVRVLDALPVSGAHGGVVRVDGAEGRPLSWERGRDGAASQSRSAMRNAEAAVGLWNAKLAEDASARAADAETSGSTTLVASSVSATPSALASALVKPAEAARAAASTQPLLASALDNAAGQAPRTLKLQLHPVELGAVTAKLSVSGGRLSVELQVETDAAREKLGRDNGEAIRVALSALGLDVERVSVQPAPNGSAAQAGGDSASNGNGNANRQAGFAAENGRGGGNGRGAGDNAQRGGESGAGGERVGGSRADGAGRAQPGLFI